MSNPRTPREIAAEARAKLDQAAASYCPVNVQAMVELMAEFMDAATAEPAPAPAPAPAPSEG